MGSSEAIFTAIILSACLIIGNSASYHYDYDYPGNEPRQPRASSNFTNEANSTYANGTNSNYTIDANSTCWQAGLFHCTSGECIRATFTCDGDPDCEDGSDEAGCSTCDRNEFRCASGQCIRAHYQCDDDKDCEDGSDEDGCSENFLRRRTEIVDEGESYFLAAVSEARIESKLKYELFAATKTAFEAVHAFRNSSLFVAADATYSELRRVVRTQERREANDEEKARVNREAGNILELANKFAVEADKFVMNSGETKVDRTDNDNYSPEARMFFLQLKWYLFWSMAASDLRLRSWAREGGDGSRFSELEEQAKGDILQAIEVIKEAMDGVLDTAMDRVGYTVYKAYKAVGCVIGRGRRNRCSDEDLGAIIPLVQDFSNNVNEAINY